MNILFPAGKPGGGDRAAHRRGKAVCMKLVTFAVPCRNAERELRALCESLLAAGDAAEIFLIDDGSADGTGRIADEYAGERPEIFRVIHQENGGIGDCIDRAVRFASGRYFKVLDPREEIDAESLVNVMKKIRRLEAAGGVDMIVTNYTIRGNDSIPDRTVRFRNVFRPGRIIGWDEEEEEHARKLVQRELSRLSDSFEQAKAAGYNKYIMFLHYPPTSILEDDSGFTDMAKEYGAEHVIYAHSHGEHRFHDSIHGEKDGIQYHLVSGDYLNWTPERLV